MDNCAVDFLARESGGHLTILTGCAKAHGLMQIIRSLQIQVAEVFVLQVLLWKLLAPAAQ